MSFKGVAYANSSIIQITEIRDTYRNPAGLQCITDKMPCCGTPPNRAGEWYFPDGTKVPIQGSATSFYRNRGDDGSVSLNRIDNNVMMPTGRFCCEVPDATNALQTVCATISKPLEFLMEIQLKGSHPFLLQSLSRLLVAWLLQQ